MNAPLLTIITSTTPDSRDILSTAARLFPIVSPNINWLIKINGVAQDFLHKYLESDWVRLYEKSDINVYDGINQALEIINSRFFQVLPAGDEIVVDALLDLLGNLDLETPTAIFAPLRFVQSGEIWHPEPNDLSERMSCPHPSSIFEVQRAKKIGGFNPAYQIAGDYDFISRYVINNNFVRITKEALVDYKGGGISDKRFFEGILECELIRTRIWGRSQFYALNNMFEITKSFMNR